MSLWVMSQIFLKSMKMKKVTEPLEAAAMCNCTISYLYLCTLKQSIAQKHLLAVLLTFKTINSKSDFRLLDSRMIKNERDFQLKELY